MRRLSASDRRIASMQQRLSNVAVAVAVTGAVQASQAATPPQGDAMPGDELPEVALDEADRAAAAALMRVNHAGEVCAQALYQAQAATARSPELAAFYRHAADEERRHLDWTERRLAALGDAPSRLRPLWHAGSLAIGTLAGMAGDRRSLGFMVETERQVERHLHRHLERLPARDVRSRAVVGQMCRDEAGHAEQAQARGALVPPAPLRLGMALVAKVMTTVAHRI